MKEARSYTVALVFLFLPSLMAVAQGNVDKLYLQAVAIKSGENVHYTAISTIYIMADKAFVVEDGGHANLKAGNRIELNPGFKVLNGGKLSATIEEVNPVIAHEPITSLSAIFPNPTVDKLTIASPQKIDMIRLIDTNGFTVMDQTGIDKADFSMDISTVKPGYYVLEIVSGKMVEKVRIAKN
jgi:Secretion system C-terminal sorting domain